MSLNDGLAAYTTVGARATGDVASARRDLFGLFACGVGLALIAMAVFAPFLAPDSPTVIVGAARAAPSAAHLLGTDQLGRDVLSRVIYGARETLLIAVVSALVAAAVGVPIGMAAGYLGRASGAVIMRLIDVFLAFPGLLLALILVTIRGPGATTVTAAIALAFMPVFARILYGTTRRIRSLDFIAAARVTGCGHLRILGRHVFPVLLPELIVVVSSAIGWTTLLAATLNFLGFGVRPPTAEWGRDLSSGASYISQAWWISAAPGIAITITILVANLVGDFLGERLIIGGQSRRLSKLFRRARPRV